jgi:hypothetical protein
MDIGERSAKRVNHLPKTFASLLLTRKRVEFDEINRHKIINSLKLTLVYNLLNKSADNRFVLFWCHKALLFSELWEFCKAKMHGVVRACAVGEVSKTVKSDNKRITASNAMTIELRKSLMFNWLPRMDSSHDKVIQSHLA